MDIFARFYIVFVWCSKLRKPYTPLFYAAISIIVPILSILVAIATSGWFDILNNALSDLGHATRSNVAPIFNTGISLGGLLVTVGAVKFLVRISKWLAVIMSATGYALVLIAVFDEVYGVIHFYVSALFFILLLVATIYYSTSLSDSKKLRNATLVLVVIALFSWILHFSLELPRGAAIPELVSIVAALPAYFHAYTRVRSE